LATRQVAVPPRGKKRSFLLDNYFYFSMSLLVAAVVVYGFSHTVDQNLIHATPPRPWILWAHGIVFSGWLVFFIFQSALVRTHNVKVHRKTGWFGVAMGALIPVLGISTAIVMDKFNFEMFHAATAKVFFSVQSWDMIAFTIPFLLAVYWRRKPEYHRRLVLVATCALTAAGFGRFPFLPFWGFYTGVDALILLGVVRDLIVNRRIHVVYRYALPLFVVGQIVALQLWTHHPAWWVRLTNAIIG
jgi:FtsH-binding integral membrane protein